MFLPLNIMGKILNESFSKMKILPAKLIRILPNWRFLYKREAFENRRSFSFIADEIFCPSQTFSLDVEDN